MSKVELPQKRSLNMDPYENMPSREELEASGAADWINDSLGEKRQLDAQLKKALKGDVGSVKSQKNDLQKMLQLPPDLNPDEPAPDLFAQERDKAHRERGNLPSLANDLKQSRQADKDLLKDLFGNL